MDPKMAWYQPEQEGPAAEVWKRVWAAEFAPSPSSVNNRGGSRGSRAVHALAAHGPSPPKPGPAPGGDSGLGQVPDFPGFGIMGSVNYYPPAYVLHCNQINQRNDEALRKENPARTFGLGVNPNVKQSHNNGCPWIAPLKTYSTGLIG